MALGLLRSRYSSTLLPLAIAPDACSAYHMRRSSAKAALPAWTGMHICLVLTRRTFEAQKTICITSMYDFGSYEYSNKPIRSASRPEQVPCPEFMPTACSPHTQHIPIFQRVRSDNSPFVQICNLMILSCGIVLKKVLNTSASSAFREYICAFTSKVLSLRLGCFKTRIVLHLVY